MLIGNTQPDGSGTYIHAVLSAEGRVQIDADSAVGEAWEPVTSGDNYDELALFEVPAGYKWRIKTLYVIYTSTATSGNRRLTLEVLDVDATTVLFEIRVGVDQAANITRKFSFAAGIQPGLGGYQDSNFIQQNIPENWILGPGQILKVYDTKAIDTADNFDAYLTYEQQVIL